MNSGDRQAPSGKRSAKVKSKANEKEQTSITREILSWVFTFSLAIFVALILKNFIIINAVVPTGSMENTIMSESNLFGNRLAYINSDPKRGDIIIFKYPDNEEEKYVKRIIGLPGEKVTIDEAKVYIDGKELDRNKTYSFLIYGERDWYMSEVMEKMGISEVDTTGPKAEGYLTQCLVEQRAQLEAPTDYIIMR